MISFSFESFDLKVDRICHLLGDCRSAWNPQQQHSHTHTALHTRWSVWLVCHLHFRSQKTLLRLLHAQGWPTIPYGRSVKRGLYLPKLLQERLQNHLNLIRKGPTHIDVPFRDLLNSLAITWLGLKAARPLSVRAILQHQTT